MADSDGNELVVVAGGTLAAPYVAQSKKRKRAAATRHENEPGLHAFARACRPTVGATCTRICSTCYAAA